MLFDLVVHTRSCKWILPPSPLCASLRQPQARGQEVGLVHLMGLLSEGVRVLR